MDQAGPRRFNLLARQAFGATGGVALPVPVDGDGLMTDTLPSARLAYGTPSHQFPLGGVLSATRRRALLAWAADAGAYIVEDDYDGEYRYDVALIPPLQTLDAGSRRCRRPCGSAISSSLPPCVWAFSEAKRLTDRHTPLLEQEALADLLASGAYERHVRSVRRKNTERRTVLLQALADDLGASITVAGAGTGLHIVLWADGVAADHEPAIIEAARAAGIGLYPVSPLYDPTELRPPMAGFLLGYAGLAADALRRGIAVLATVLARHR